MEKEEFARRLIELRMNKGVSSQQMSYAIGQNHAYIYKIESGGGYPKMEKFFFICDYLGITPQEFFETDIPDPIKSKKVYQAISALTSEQLDAVLNMIKAMKK